METLPRDLLFDLLLHLKNTNLLNLCNTNKRLAQFCDESNDYFWQQKVLLDYSDIPPKPNNISWKRYYVQLGTNHLKRIPLYYNEELLGHIWISRDDTTKKILQISNQIFKLRYPNDYPVNLTNGAHFTSPEYLSWKLPLYELVHLDQPLLREMYNGTHKLVYLSMSGLSRATLIYEYISKYITV